MDGKGSVAKNLKYILASELVLASAKVDKAKKKAVKKILLFFFSHCGITDADGF